MKKPRTPPSIADIISGLDLGAMRLVIAIQSEPCANGRYVHWDKVRHLTPPEGLSKEQWWAAMKIARGGSLKPLALKNTQGDNFCIGSPDPVLEYVHRIDREAAGQIAVMDATVLHPSHRDRYLVRSLVAEAITSSQLEGAVTTRRVAKEMIRSNRPPRDKSERMILNNYRAMQHIIDLKEQKLSESIILDLHRILTDSTITDERGALLADQVGRFQRPGEGRIGVFDQYNEQMHMPPPAEELPERLAAMIDFANGETPDFFMHPVVRSIILHFWLAHDHPFYDGNGRTARALFYWSMLRHGYWKAEFISISEIIRRGPAKYGRAFLYTESDGNDLTYFVLYHLDVIQKAIDAVDKYVAKKTGEVRAVEALLRDSIGLNYRQKAMLSHALRHPNAEYTVKSHQTCHRVVHQTARADLYDLAGRGLLMQQKAGRSFLFTPSPQLEDLLKKLT